MKTNANGTVATGNSLVQNINHKGVTMKITSIIAASLLATTAAMSSIPAQASATEPSGAICTAWKGGNEMGYTVKLSKAGKMNLTHHPPRGACTSRAWPGWSIVEFRVYSGYVCVSQWGYIYKAGTHKWTGKAGTTLTLTCYANWT